MDRDATGIMAILSAECWFIIAFLGVKTIVCGAGWNKSVFLVVFRLNNQLTMLLYLRP
jgi:hypothetical protein